MGKRFLSLCFALLLVSTAAFAAEEIKVGSINDLTGATSDVGKDAALGVKECVTFINDNGGINGKKIKLFLYDYGYRVPEAITIYKRFRDQEKIQLLLQWGTGDTEALVAHGQQGPNGHHFRFTFRPFVQSGSSTAQSSRSPLQLRLFYGLLHQCQGRPNFMVREGLEKIR